MNWSNLAIMVDRNFFLKVIINEAEITDSNKKINGFKIKYSRPLHRSDC